MTQTDERILEFVESEVKASPKEIAESGYVSNDNKYISQRLKVLLGSGLVQRVSRGLYRITPKGREYLSGDADLRDEEKPD